MQLEPGTMGLTDSQRADPTTNIQAGAMYLASLYRLFHSWRDASTAYYGGTGLVLAFCPVCQCPGRRPEHGCRWCPIRPPIRSLWPNTRTRWPG
jgi:hypothetical protein